MSIAKAAAQSAGKYIAESFGDRAQLVIEQKSLNDFVSEVDRHSEQVITAELHRHFPSHRILGEEYGVSGGLESPYTWIIDPLDGTTNFLRGIPHFAVSIGLKHDDQLVLGVVYDPVKNELFSAELGRGAQMNGQTISVTNGGGLHGALLATGVPYSGDPLASLSAFTSTMTTLLAQQTSGIRRLGAAALDLAYVAAGRYDGFWESHLKPWDIAAGALLVTEAGGVVSDLAGRDNYLESGHVMAAGVQVHQAMLPITAQTYLHL
ncbi:inositol monophosphatase [Arenicella chitinivorans]|uniref:Inositol-1-monophosphatase n=1 Tax=Arenicella chitinivorans TaxID=1329800 RepID=A0A918VQ37_9GAMM|nr:inositol monophosphatase family protein [Arenicella chitinivorans]GHA15912.1 inositol monophosphatase [Arenicella chitinivorans]